MSFLSGVAQAQQQQLSNAAAQSQGQAGYGLIGEAAGALGSLTGNKSLQVLGSNIVNPNVTLTNPGGLFQSNDPAFSGPGAYGNNSNVKNSSSTNTTGSTTPQGQVLGANTATGSGSPSSSTINEINQTYDPLLNTYQSYLSGQPAWQQHDTDLANRAYDAQGQTYQDQYNSGNANLDQQTKVVNDSYQRSLQQLGNDLRNQYQGQINALGVNGAGDSSAGQMTAYALAQQQNLNRGYMNTDLNNQLTQIGLQRNDLNKSYGDEMNQLQASRDQAMSDIAKSYYQLQQQIMNDMQSTETAKKNAMLWTNNWAANQVAGVDNSIMQKVSDLNDKYSSLASQTPQNLSFTPSYQAQNIVAPTVGAQATTSQQIAPSQVLLAPGYNANNNQNQLPLAAVLNNNQHQTAY